MFILASTVGLLSEGDEEYISQVCPYHSKPRRGSFVGNGSSMSPTNSTALFKKKKLKKKCVLRHQTPDTGHLTCDI